MPLTDSYGLYVDPDGDFTLDPAYNAADCAALDPSSPLYEVNLDDETADNASPVSLLEHKYRLRQRSKRKKAATGNFTIYVELAQDFTDLNMPKTAAFFQACAMAELIMAPQ